MNALQKASIKQIADHYGLQHQIDKAFEELDELKEELAKYYFRFLDNDDEINTLGIIDEIADVKIMLAQLEHLLEIKKDVHAREWFKINRQLERIREEKEEKKIAEDDRKCILTSAIKEVEKVGVE